MKVEQALEKARRGLDKVRRAGGLEPFLEYASKGNMHNLTIDQLLAAYAQNPNATTVAPYWQWARMGRRPWKGAGIGVPSKDGTTCNHLFDLRNTSGGAERAVYANLDSDIGSVTRLRNAVGKGLDDAYDRLREKLESEERNLETAKAEIGAEFQHEEELNRLLKRQDELFLLLSGPQQESQEAPADYNLETKIAKVASANEGADPFRPCARRGR